MKPRSFFIAATLCAISLGWWGYRSHQSKQSLNERTLHVGIVSIVEHPFLDDARRGFVETFQKQLDQDTKVTFDYRNAFGKVENANTIVSAFMGNKVDLIFSISTPATQAAVSQSHGIPIVFCAVTDPVGTRIANSISHPGGNITGVSDKIPVEYLLSTIKRLLPRLKRLGVPYNVGEANSVSLVNEMRSIADQFGIELVESNASTTADVHQAVSSMVGRVDAVFMIPDNTMSAAENVISDICDRNRIPYISSIDRTSIEGRALASITTDHYKLGAQSAQMSLRIMCEGVSPGTISIEYLDQYDVIVNKRVADDLGVVIDESLAKLVKLVQ